MKRSRWTIAVALVALSGACGGGGSNSSGDTNAAVPTPAPVDPAANSPRYDVNAAMQALFSGRFAESHAAAEIDGFRFYLKVTPIGVGPSASALPATYLTSFLALQLMADGYWNSYVIGYQYEGSPTHIVGASMSTSRGTAIYADAAEPFVPLPTAAAIGQSQQWLRAAIYEFDYSAGYDKPPAKVPFPGWIARGWRLDPDNAESAYLCLIDEYEHGEDKGFDDYCYSIRPDGQPTGRFKATLTDTDTGARFVFEQVAGVPVPTPGPAPLPPAPSPPPPAPEPTPVPPTAPPPPPVPSEG